MSHYQPYYDSYQLLPDGAKAMIANIGGSYYRLKITSLTSYDHQPLDKEMYYGSRALAEASMTDLKTSFPDLPLTCTIDTVDDISDDAKVKVLDNFRVNVVYANGMWRAVATLQNWHILRAICVAIVACESTSRLIKVANDLIPTI